MPKIKQKFNHKYVFIFLYGEYFPSVKFESDTAYNASLQFLHDYVRIEKEEDFEANEGRTTEEMSLKIYPNNKLAEMLELDTKKQYNVMVIREDKLKKAG